MPLDPDELNNKNKGNGKNKPVNGNDDYVGSSFAVQFKPGDKANSVSDKLKESSREPHDDFDAFKDEFDDFVFDESITPFKPSEDSEAAKSAFEPKGGAQPVRPAHVAPAAQSRPAPAPEKKDSGIPAFPKDGGTFDRKPSDDVSKGPDKSNTPVYGAEDKGKVKPISPSQKKDEKLFTSGNNLDYATSEHDKNKSPFANAKRPDMPTPDEVDIPKAEKKPEVKTYGTVSSGVNAFGSAKNQDNKQEKAKEEGAAASPFVIRPTPSPKPAAPKAPEAKAPEAKAPEAHKAPAAPAANAPKAEPSKPAAHVPPAAAKSAHNDKPAHTPPAAAKAENEAKDAKSAPAAHTPPAAHKAPKAPAQEAPAKSIIPGKEAAPAAAAAAAAATEAAEKPVGQRPGEIAKQKAPTLTRPAPTGAAIDSIRPEDPRRMLAVEKSQKAASSTPHEKPNISPVDTVKKTRKKKETKSSRDPGVGGIIALVVIIAAFIGILLLLQNLDKITSVFGRKPVETLPTIQTTTTAVVTTAESTTEATTTEATTAETTTEATTESTTEATTTTTEATTKATTKDTTKATSSGNTSTGIATKAFKTKVSNFRATSNGFKFDISMTNGSGKTASLKKSLSSFSIQLTCSSSIKSLSSKYLNFKLKNGYWVGTPNDVSIKPGQKLTITVTVKTSSKPAYYAYNKCNFKWN